MQPVKMGAGTLLHAGTGDDLEVNYEVLSITTETRTNGEKRGAGYYDMACHTLERHGAREACC